ncbi:MAG TPA: 3-beta hydroxysteroid dehydrogenase [Cyanobacteria bacterium UBA8156]|nr:3-beta hydroxysteroid dehydrogenase [Cyanobacteria bacterium UBA8156]
MKVLVMGGTRFIGVALVKQLVAQGHEVTVFNRGTRPAPAGVRTLVGDRTDAEVLRDRLAAEDFDAIFDNTGRELKDTQPLVELFRGRLRHFVYVSSAGVYQASDLLPHFEGDATDPQSRHRGKRDTEVYLEKAFAEDGFPFTAVRPVYIYGPHNYNDIEAWFFDRLVRDRPIPIPGPYLTQLGHVEDLAAAMAAILGNTQAIGEIYNISDVRYITFAGLAQQCAIAAGRDANALSLPEYNPATLNLGKRKGFPLRAQHFIASVEKAMSHLDWEPEYDLASGLRSSWEAYQHSDRPEPDFSTDDWILQAIGA